MKRWTNFFLLRRLVLATTALVAMVLFDAPVASAEALVVVTSSPADGASLEAAPASISITYNQPIGSAVTMTVSCNGGPMPVPAAKTSADQLTMVLDLSVTPLSAGNCVVDWSAQALDGPVTSGSLGFKIAQATVVTAPGQSTATTIAATSTQSTPPEIIDTSEVTGPLFLGRLMSSIGLAVLFGAFVLVAVAWPEGVEYVLTIRFLRSAYFVALAGSLLLVVCLSAQISGEGFSASLNPTSWFDLADSLPGKAALARLALCAASGWAAFMPERVIDPTSQLPALAIPGLAVATMGFSRSGGDLELVGYAAGMAHAVAMAVWFGGLVLLARVVLSGPGQEDLIHGTRGFGRLATPAIAVTVLTGVIQMYRLDSGHLLDSGHGQVLLLKVVGVVGVVFIGVATRQFVQQRLARAEVLTAAIANRLRRAVGMEALGGAIILLLTSWLLTLQPGNLSADVGPGSYAFQKQFVEGDGATNVSLYVTPSKVGRNSVYVTLKKPVTGITNFTLTFTPPSGSLASKVVFSPSLLAPGSALLPLDQGIPLNEVGTWTVTLSVLTVDHEFRDETTFTVSPADGAITTASIPVVTLTPVTAVVTLPIPAVIESTTTVTTP